MNEGAKKLLKYISAEEKRLGSARGFRALIARNVGTSSSVISRWLRGARIPVARYRIRLQRECGIPIDAWDVER